MTQISFKRPIPKIRFIYGIGLFFIGILSIENILSLLFFGLGLYFFHTNGIEINLIKKKHRITVHLLGLTFGKWTNFPQIEYVSVFKTTQTTRVWVSAASANVTNTIIKVNLFYNTNQKIEAYETENVDEAFKKAHQIAKKLNIDILDATERESKWL